MYTLQEGIYTKDIIGHMWWCTNTKKWIYITYGRYRYPPALNKKNDNLDSYILPLTGMDAELLNDYTNV